MPGNSECSVATDTDQSQASDPGAASERIRKAIPRRYRRRVVDARHSIRGLNASRRALPSFLVIGTQRGGTSSLFRYLSGHPQVMRPLRKESEYFSGRFAQTENWYRANFPTRSSLSRGSTGERVTFEATPDYLLFPKAPAHAHDLVPDAKLVALLRNPTERAFSHYNHMVRLGFETIPFEEAIHTEEERCAEDWARLAQDETYRPRNVLRFTYVERGHYADQLGNWLDHYPPSSMHIVLSEDFFGDPPGTFAGIVEFLGLDPWLPPEMPNHSVSADTSRSVPESARTWLDEHYAGHNRRLAELIGRDPGWAA